MSTRPPAPAPHRPHDRRLHLVGALIAAFAAIAALVAVNTASVGATSAAESTDPSRAAHRVALGAVDEAAIDTLEYHAPDLADSVWCSAMEHHTGDWDGFAEKVATASVNWSTSEAGMFEFVGVVVQSVCPETSVDFLASTS